MKASGAKPGGGRNEGRAGTARHAFFSGHGHSRLAVALVISLFFHLSMITVFRIVVMLPRERVHFYEVQIVSAPDSNPDAPLADAANRRAEDTLALSGADPYEVLPEVALPVLEFAELERLRIRYDALEPLTDGAMSVEDTVPTDSWARFGGELQRLGRSLRELALPEERETATARVEAQPRKVLQHRPAEGFQAHIEWSGPPRDRELLFAPPIKALWQLDPAAWMRPLEIVFKVDPGGRVVNVWSPLLDESGMLEDIQMAVLQYRFAPLHTAAAEAPLTEPVAESGEQSGILFISATEGGP